VDGRGARAHARMERTRPIFADPRNPRRCGARRPDGGSPVAGTGLASFDRQMARAVGSRGVRRLSSSPGIAGGRDRSRARRYHDAGVGAPVDFGIEVQVGVSAGGDPERVEPRRRARGGGGRRRRAGGGGPAAGRGDGDRRRHRRMPPWGLFWLAAGGVSYTVGIPFYAVSHHVRYSHAVWHLMVIVGTTCHFFAVLW